MNEETSDLLDRARGLAIAKALIDRAILDLIMEAAASDQDITSCAKALGVHRSTLYRRLPET